MSDTGSVIGGDEPRFTPEMIERLRQTGIRLDRRGRFWHEGAQITHPGFCRALLRWLDRLDDGRPIIRLDERRYAYIDVDDAELLASSARWDGDRAFLTLNDGSEEELAYASLRVGDADALYCSVRGGRLEARVTTPAYYVLAECIEPAGSGDDLALPPGPEPCDRMSMALNLARTSPDLDGEFVLRARGRAFPIGRRV